MSNRETLFRGLTPPSNCLRVPRPEQIKMCIELSQQPKPPGPGQDGVGSMATWQFGIFFWHLSGGEEPESDTVLILRLMDKSLSATRPQARLGDTALWQETAEHKHPQFSALYDVGSYPQSTNEASGIRNTISLTLALNILHPGYRKDSSLKHRDA